MRPECLGIIGWLFGHHYETTYDSRRMRLVMIPWCTRCGLKFEEDESAQRDGLDGAGTLQP